MSIKQNKKQDTKISQFKNKSAWICPVQRLEVIWFILAEPKIFLQAASGKFADKIQKSNMVAPLKAEHGYSGRKMKPCKYSILNAKVTEVTSGNYPTFSRIAVNKGFLDFWKNGKKIERA